MTNLASERTLRTAALFGISLDDEPSAPASNQTAWIALALHAILSKQHRIVFITGASGAGKTTLLDHLVRSASIPTVKPVRTLPRTTLIDAVGRTLEESIRCLALAGIADATRFVRATSCLSAGEQERARVARTIADARHTNSLLVIDEFTSNLDRTTARTLASALARAVRSGNAGAGAIIASPHDDLLEPLAPDALVVSHLDLPPTLHTSEPQ